MRMDDPSHLLDSFIIRATEEQDWRIEAAIQRRVFSPGEYTLFNQNCAQTVLDILSEAGLIVPNAAKSVAPRKSYQALKRFYAK
jgi:protein involved in polysaccharide export with SLBB domain